MKNILLRTVLISCILYSAYPVLSQLPNPVKFNTAVNAALTGTISTGFDDLSWTAAMTSSTGPFVPAKVAGNVYPGGWADSPYPTANWVSYPHTCTPVYAEHACLGNLDEFYRLIFTLPENICGQPVSDSGVYCLSMELLADNWIHEIFVNGVSAIVNPHANPYYGMGFTLGNKLKAALCNSWVAGTNVVLVHVKSSASPGWSGLLAYVNASATTTSTLAVTTPTPGPRCMGETITFTASGASSYSWQPGNLAGQTVTVLPQSTTVYTLIGYDANGCSGTGTFTQTMLECVGIKQNTGAHFRLSVDQVTGDLLIWGTEPGANIVIGDINGRIIRTMTAAAAETVVTPRIRPPGIYFVTVSSGTSSHTEKVILFEGRD